MAWSPVTARTVYEKWISDCVDTARLCERAGADAIDVSAYGNVAQAIAFTEAPLVHEPGGFLAFARAVKQAVSIPVIAVGRVEPADGERGIAAGHFDFLAMGRKLLADPDLPNKLQAGEAQAVRPCIYCYICVSQIFINKPVFCAVNTSTGVATPARKPKAGAAAAAPSASPRAVSGRSPVQANLSPVPTSVRLARRIGVSGVMAMTAAPSLRGPAGSCSASRGRRLVAPPASTRANCWPASVRKRSPS